MYRDVALGGLGPQAQRGSPGGLHDLRPVQEVTPRGDQGGGAMCPVCHQLPRGLHCAQGRGRHHQRQEEELQLRNLQTGTQ